MKEFFFHKQYGISIPKRLPTSNSCCFKANEAVELEQNGIFHLFCSRIFLLITLLQVQGYPVDHENKYTEKTHVGAI